MSKLLFLLLLTAGLLGIAAAVLTTHLSLWFLWEAAPAGDVRLAVSQSHAAGDTISEYALAWLVPELGPYRNDIRSFVISRQGENITLLAQPKFIFSPSTQREVARQLTRDGWQVERRGLALVARDHTGELPNPYLAALRAIRQQLRFRPLALLEIGEGAVSWYRQPLAAAVTADGSEVTILTAPDIEHLPSKTVPAGFPAAAEMSFTLPGAPLAGLPPDVSAEWNALLVLRLGFKHTAPHLIGPAAGRDSVFLSITETGAAFGATGSTQSLKDTLQEALAAEEAYLRPQERAFRLPDGTIGREVVPGEERETTSPAPGSCTEAAALAVCTNGSAVAIGTTADRARQALEPGPWHVRLGEKYLRGLPFKLKAAAATGDSGTAVIHLKIDG
jgi:hypothetical protein